MTFDEVRKLQISNIIGSTPEFKALAKECLSIAASSTAKDNEVSMCISAAVEDMTRNNINVLENLSNGLIQAGIITYVKAKFGYGEDEEKARCESSYRQILTDLSLSQKFLLEE